MRPAPAAKGRASAGDTGKSSRLKSTPGTATAAMGMAAKLSTMPTGATVPNAHAVIGAVASVAPVDDPSVRHPKLRPRAASVHRLNRVAPQSAAADNHPPRSSAAHGSTSSTARQVAASSSSLRTCRCATRQRAATSASAAARVAGAGQPRNPT